MCKLVLLFKCVRCAMRRVRRRLTRWSAVGAVCASADRCMDGAADMPPWAIRSYDRRPMPGIY